MQAITKNPSLATHFKKWVEENQTVINIGEKKFDNIPPKIKKVLQDGLLQEQKYICCFCGKRIDKHEGWVEIAHFKPQEISKEEQKFIEIFDYDNLFASCNGGTSYRKYQIFKNTTAKELIDTFEESIYLHREDKYLPIQTIDNQKVVYYNLSKGKREKYRPNFKRGDTIESIITKLIEKHNDFEEHILYRKEVVIELIQPTEILREGTYVFVGKPYGNEEYHHCNNKQKNQALHFSFFDANLSSYFFYNDEGEICVKDKENVNLAKDIGKEVLNLNSIYLKAKREKIVSFVNNAFLVERLLDLEEDRINFYEKYSSVEKLPEFAFVYLNELNRLL